MGHYHSPYPSCSRARRSSIILTGLMGRNVRDIRTSPGQAAQGVGVVGLHPFFGHEEINHAEDRALHCRAQLLAVVEHDKIVGGDGPRTLNIHSLFDSDPNVAVGGAFSARAAHRSVAHHCVAVAHGQQAALDEHRQVTACCPRSAP